MQSMQREWWDARTLLLRMHYLQLIKARYLPMFQIGVVASPLRQWAALHFISSHWFCSRASMTPVSNFMLQPSRSPRDFFLILTFLNSWCISNGMTESNNSKTYIRKSFRFWFFGHQQIILTPCCGNPNRYNFLVSN